MGVHDDEIKQRIKSAREAKGMSQAELARIMQHRGYDFKQQTINKIEKGERKVSAAELVAFASAIDVSAAALLGLGEDRSQLLMAGARLEEAMRGLSASAVAYARAMLSYAQAADTLEQVHALDDEFLQNGFLRQTPGWIATGDTLPSIEASLKINRVRPDGTYATKLLKALHEEQQLLHGSNDG